MLAVGVAAVSALLWITLGWAVTGRRADVPWARFAWNWVYNIHVIGSQALNVFFLFGDPDESTSGRIGKSILREGLASRVPWPGFLRRHWLAAVERDEGQDSASGRLETV
jgi:hypothetical protein